jgi:hypothetical protein
MTAPGATGRGFAAPVHEVASVESWPDYAEARRWTDGAPVYPPTEAAVAALLDAIDADPAAELGTIPPRHAVVTVETVAINGVMAGCRPEHMPVVIAALDALLAPEFNLQGVQTTTHPCEPLAIISGPAVARLGLWSEECVFGGGGNRANVAIGRAIRLLLWNVGGGYPGSPTRKILGHPGRLSFVLPESANSPWPPFHADRGVAAEASAVTMFACEAPHSVLATIGTDLSPLLILDRIADHMRALGSNNSTTQGQQLVVLSPFLAQHLDAHGWDRSRVRQHLWDCARRPLAQVRPRSAQRPDNDPRWWWPWLPPDVDQSDDSSLVPSASDPASIHVVVSGASGGRFCAVCPGWGHFGGFAVTKPVNTGASRHDRERGDKDAGS